MLFDFVYWLNFLRPSFGNFTVIHGGGLIVISLMLLFFLVNQTRFSTGFIAWVILTVIYVLIQFLYLTLSNAPLNSVDMVDPIRLFVPWISFSFGYKLGGKVDPMRLVALSTVVLLVWMLAQWALPTGNFLHRSYSVENLLIWSRYSGTFFNHIEPGWILIAMAAVSVCQRNRLTLHELLLLLVTAVAIILLTRSKATLVVAFGSLSVIGLFRAPRLFMFIAPFAVIVFVSIISSVPYFSKAYVAFMAGDYESNVSIYLRYLDYQTVLDGLSNGNFIIFGMGKATELGDYSYMGTSLLMYIFRYGLLGALIVYGSAYVMIRRSMIGKLKALALFAIVLGFDMIANGSEAQKGLMVFYTIIGVLAARQDRMRERNFA